MDINQLWAQFGAAHPVYSHLIALAIGMGAGNRLIAAAENQIPKMVDWVDRRQVALLRKAGLTDEQLWSVREHEAKDMHAAAAEIETSIAAERAAAVAAVPKA